MKDAALVSEEVLLEVRPRLLRFFSSHGRAWAADELADDVILRVLTKRRQGEVIENVTAYSLGIARFVLLEHLRSPASRQEPLDVDVAADDFVAEDGPAETCLDGCLGQLPPGARALILRFYGEGEYGAKNKDVRKHLAVELGISMDALFLRASKLRRRLRQCMEPCLSDPENLPDRKSSDHSLSRRGPA
jgi:DNA-directed RNA polymerase specialized sigma24 family protein